MSRSKVAAFWIVGLVLSVVVLEVGSAVTMTAADLVRGRSLVQVRHMPDTLYGGKLRINRHGFIENGHEGDLLNRFPEKPGNL